MSSQESDSISLEGTKWTMINIMLLDQEIAPISNEEAHITFTEGQIGGTAGCNNMFGNYSTSDKSNIQIGPIGSTYMLCRDELMVQERNVLQILEGARSYTIKGNSLYIHQSEETYLVFEAN